MVMVLIQSVDTRIKTKSPMTSHRANFLVFFQNVLGEKRLQFSGPLNTAFAVDFSAG